MSLTSALTNVNWLAVLVAAIIHLVLGLIWFQKKLFGNAWVELSGKTLDPAQKWIPAGVIGHLLMSYVLAVIINLAGAVTMGAGALIGLLALVGFVIPLECGELVWEKIPFKLWLIRVGNQLVGLSITGAILAVWH
jgi:hypothetical protein